MEPVACHDRLTIVDEIECAAIRDEGFDPDDPDVIAAIDLVRWELSMLRVRPNL